MPLVAQNASKIVWSSYFSGGNADVIQTVAADKDGSVWVAGISSSNIDYNTFVIPNEPIQWERKGGADVFVAKYRPEANGKATVLYWTWLGGSGDEDVRSVAIDSRGRLCLTGTTTSSDFPLGGAAFQTTPGGAADTYVAVIDPTINGETALVFSTYYGAANNDVATGLAIEPNGNLVVVGYTNSEELPSAASGLQSNGRGATDAFLIRVNPNEGTLDYATYFGGQSTDFAYAVAIGPDGHVWMTGYTASGDFPFTEDGGRAFIGAPFDAYVVRFDFSKPGLDALVYCSALGGNGTDVGQGIFVTPQNRVWVAGHTASNDLPATPDAVQRTFGGGTDMFVMSFDAAQPQNLNYVSYLGGGGHETVYGFALLDDGRYALAGYTMFGGLPTAGGDLPALPRSAFADAFVTIANSRVAGAAAVEYSGYLGGRFNDVANGVSAANGSLFVAGYTSSDDFPTTDGTTLRNPAPFPAGFIAKIARPSVPPAVSQ